MDEIPIWLELIAKIMQIVTGISAVAIAVIVYNHNRRKDKESVRAQAWQAQQQINYSVIREINVLRASELTIDGAINPNSMDDDIRGAVYFTFVQLNRTHLLWSAWKSKILSEQELYDEIRPTLILIIGNPMITKYCLTRGYSKDFVEFLEGEISYVNQEIQKPQGIDEFIVNLRNAYNQT